MLAVARAGGEQRALLRAVDLLIVVVDRGLLIQRAVALRDLIVTAAGLGKKGIKHGIQRCHRRARQLDCRRADAITVGFVAVERHKVALILREHIRAFEQRGDQDQVAAVHIVRRERQGLCARRLSHDRAGRGPRRGDLRGRCGRPLGDGRQRNRRPKAVERKNDNAPDRKDGHGEQRRKNPVLALFFFYILSALCRGKRIHIRSAIHQSPPLCSRFHLGDSIP